MAAELVAGSIPGHRPKLRPYRKRALSQVVALQEEAYSAAVDPQTPVKERAAFMRAWCDLTEERRKLEMRPLPKPIDVTKVIKPARVKQLAKAWTDPSATSTEQKPSSTEQT